MRFKKHIRIMIQKASIPNVSSKIQSQLPSVKTTHHTLFRGIKSPFILQFSAFLLLLLGVSMFSYQQSESQIYAFSDYEEVMGISTGLIRTYFDDSVIVDVPLSMSTSSYDVIDQEINLMVQHIILVEKMVMTQRKVIQRKRMNASKEIYDVSFETSQQDMVTYELELEKNYQQFKKDVFAFEGNFDDINISGYTTFNNAYHHLYVSAQKTSKEVTVEYDSESKNFMIRFVEENVKVREFEYQLIRNNFDMPTLRIAYTNQSRTVNLTLNYLPMMRKIHVSYEIIEASNTFLGLFQMGYRMMNGMTLLISGKTEDQQTFNYEFSRFQKNEMDYQ